jgi:plasmid stability protein
MANLQVKNLPDTLHQRLRRYAQKHTCTLSDVVLTAIERELARREWHERLARRPTTDLEISAAALLEQERRLASSSCAGMPTREKIPPAARRPHGWRRAAAR